MDSGIADHAGIENNFPRDLGEGAEAFARPDAAVFEDEDRFHGGLRKFAVLYIPRRRGATSSFGFLACIIRESRWLRMQGAEGDAVLVALRTLRNEADAAISARPDSQGSRGTCFGSQGEQSVA